MHGVSARMFAKHNAVGFYADGFRRHDLVGDTILQHAMLMNPGFVRKSILADNGLVWLHEHASDVGEQLARTINLLARHVSSERQEVFAHAQSHNDLFER